MMTELAGHMIDERYRFDLHLGEGTFAKVYRVHDMRRNVDLAAKVLKTEVAENPEFVERFRREGEVLSRLQHPHIVRYYDLIETEEAVFILMDYIPGQTLQAHLHRLGRPMNVTEAFNYLKPLTAALHYAHGEGIIHRDLKPGNVLLHENGTLLVTDFGIAQILDESGNAITSTNFGTPLYMAPEQILNETVTPATDIYSLGVVLYQLLTGVVPFGGTTPNAIGKTPSERIAYEHLHVPAPFVRNQNPEIPLAVEEVILRCLAKSPMRRPTSVREVYNELAEAIGAAPSELTPLPLADGQDRPEITLPEISQFVKLAAMQENNDDTQETNGLSRVVLGEEETAEAVFPKEVVEGRPDTQESRYARVPQYLPPDEVSIMNPTPPGVIIPKASAMQQKTPTAGIQLPKLRRQPRWNATMMMIGGLALVLISCVALTAYMSGIVGGDSSGDKVAVGDIPTITPDDQAERLIQTNTPQPTVTITLTVESTAAPTEVSLFADLPLYSDGLIVYASHRTGNLDLYVTDPNATLASRLQLTTDASLNETGPSVSPDGRQIAFYAAPVNSDDYDVYLMDFDGSNGSNIRNLTESPDEDDRYVAWSPDGTTLAFHSNRREGGGEDPRDYEIYLYDIETGQVEQLTENSVNDFGPDWSPDGTQMAYYSYENGWHIYVMDMETRETAQITPDDLEARFPSWSPDGSQLAFHVTAGDSAQLYLMNADGSNVRPLIREPRNDSFPDWSPDGTQIIFQRQNSDGVYGLFRFRLEDELLLPVGNPLGDFFPDWTDASSS